ncbi:MAG TPA: DUF4920 domain-containing protein [Chitinophagales bacterium]|nr:DUF4920 domain-containing protein [Chitinophagales bacterium]
MKTLFIATLILGTLSNCFAQKADKTSKKATQQGNNDLVYCGKKISDDGAITPAELLERMKGKEKMKAKVIANIVSVCQVKGCWMLVDIGNGEQMRVTFKDYGFFVPKDCSGKTVIMEGFAYYKTTSAELLRHYAEDAGKTQDEIEAITEPEYTLVFEAEGVIVK